MSLNVDSIALYAGESIQLRPLVLDSRGQVIEDADLDWTSLDTDVLVADSTGALEAVGHGTTQLRVEVDDVTLHVPVRVTKFVQISGLSSNLCALDAEGAAWCRGRMYRGFMGPDFHYADEFTRLPSGLVFSDIAVGGRHACGIAAGRTYCWGGDEDGTLGRGWALTALPDTVHGGHRFVSLTAGMDHTCGLDAEGAAFCWGRPWEGQLGRGSRDSAWVYEEPGPVVGDLRWTVLDAGWDNTCGIATDGVTYCWGALLEENVPTPVASMPANGSAVSGDGFVACGGAGTAVYCESGSPAWPEEAVSGSVALPGPVVLLSSARAHACALVDTGDVYCWGQNAGAFLGNGSISGSTEPERVAADEPFVDVRAGFERSCALTEDGAVYCWGLDVWDGTSWSNRGEPSVIPLRIRPPAP